jgi:hypothetical protein
MQDDRLHRAFEAAGHVGRSPADAADPARAAAEWVPLLPGVELVEAAEHRLECERPLLETLAQILPV